MFQHVVKEHLDCVANVLSTQISLLFSFAVQSPYTKRSVFVEINGSEANDLAEGGFRNSGIPGIT